MDDGADAAGAGLQTRHGVVLDGEASRQRHRFVKVRKVAPNSFRRAWIFLLTFRGVENEESVHYAIVVEVVHLPIHLVSYAENRFFSESSGQKRTGWSCILARPVLSVRCEVVRRPDHVWMDRQGQR